MKPNIPLPSPPSANLFAVALIAVAIGGCSAGAIDAVDLAPGALFEGLIAHWTFDEGTGTTVTDSTASHHDGTLLPLGTTWLPREHFGGALRFDGTDQSEVQVPGFPKPTGSWSVAGWVRTPDIATNGYTTIVSTEIPLTPTALGGGWQLNLLIGTPSNPMNNTSLYQYAFWKGATAGDYSYEECDCFVPDQWAHVAGVFDADKHEISIYHNGSFVGLTADEPKILDGTDTLWFGRWGFDTTRRLVGDLDDFAVYNRALTPPEIKQLASAPLPATPPP